MLKIAATNSNIYELVQDKSISLDAINTKLVTNMSGLFYQDCRKNFDGIETWDMSNITDTSWMFAETKYFNHNISGWNMSKVQDMSNMFAGAKAFNQNINAWNTSSVIDVSNMFYKAEVFNQPLENWDMSNVENMKRMFAHATLFDQSLIEWNVDINNAVYLNNMFIGSPMENKFQNWKWNWFKK